MRMDAQTFSDNLKKILGLPERKKQTAPEQFAPRILSQTGSVTLGGADGLLATPEPTEQPETPTEPDTWALPDFCRLFLPDDESGQCYCLRGHREERYPCPVYYRAVNYTRDDWVNQVEKYVTATISYSFSNKSGLVEHFNRSRVVGWSEIVKHVNQFKELANNDDFNRAAEKVKKLMPDMRNAKAIIPQMENSDGFVAGFLEEDRFFFEEHEGEPVYNKTSNDGRIIESFYPYEWLGRVGYFDVEFSSKRHELGNLGLSVVEEGRFYLRFELVDVPRLPRQVKLEPPIVPECIALRVTNTGFYATCSIDHRLPEKFKTEKPRTLSMVDENSNTVSMVVNSDWGITVQYLGWSITLNADFVPVDAFKMSSQTNSQPTYRPEDEEIRDEE